MNQESLLTELVLRRWIALLPFWVTLLAGIIVAIVFWKHCPRASLLSILALLLLGLAAVVQPLVTSFVGRQRVALGWSSVRFDEWTTIVTLTFNLVRAIAYSLFLWAVFTGRRTSGPIYPPLPTDPRYR